MKESIKKKTHNGTQPIRVLKHNLTSRLVKRNADYIKKLKSDFKIQPNIKYNINEIPLIERQCPFIELNGQINIHETYLSYVWINCYFLFVIYEECLHIPDTIKRGEIPRKKRNEELIKNARKLFDYGISLVKVFYEWDKKHLPNPEFYDKNSEEGWYIERTNDLFTETLNFIMYHEMAHAELLHIKKIKDLDIEPTNRKEFEIEADNRAIDLIISNCRDRNASELSIIIGLASMLFFKDNLSGGKYHPDVNIRIKNATDRLKLKDENEVWATLCIFIKEWSDRFDLRINQKGNFKNYKDYYDMMTNQI